MHLLFRLLIISLFSFNIATAFAGGCGNNAKSSKGCVKTYDTCCGQMGGVQYCDSSAGRLVCKNGFYSSCYCNRHAVMDLEHIQGCCLWQGGVLHVEDATGLVVCNNGAVSEVCSLQEPAHSIATF